MCCSHSFLSPIPFPYVLQSSNLVLMGSLVPCLQVLGCLVPVSMPLGYSDTFLHVPVFPVSIPTFSGSVVLCLCVLGSLVPISVTLVCSVPCLCVPGAPVPVAAVSLVPHLCMLGSLLPVSAVLAFLIPPSLHVRGPLSPFPCHWHPQLFPA